MLKEIEGDRSVSVAGLMHWRTIAEAQVAKEKEKARRSGKEGSGAGTGSTVNSTPTKQGKSSIKSTFASTLFGNSPARTPPSSDKFYESLDESENSNNSDAALISLTVDEMKELEDLALEKADHRSLTKDSMFCDINFNLEAFKVHLFDARNVSLASLEMGTVAASFRANADGSLTSGLTLRSLDVADHVTPGTFFPTVCRSLQNQGGVLEQVSEILESFVVLLENVCVY